MNKKEFISRVADAVRENGARKPVRVSRHVFNITDDSGNSAKFVIKEKNKEVMYTTEDAGIIIDACLAVIEDALKHGEEISIKGFGSLGLHYRAARRTKQPGTEEWFDVDARYVPKFWYGNDLRMAARVFELSSAEDEERKNLQHHEPYEDGDE